MRITGNVRLNSQEVYELLTEFDKVFKPNISEQVELEQYSLKLSQNACFVIAQNEEENLNEGFIVYYLNSEEHFVFIPFIGVKHKGIGHLMIDNLISNLGKEYNRIILECRKRNQHAYNFYLRNGFYEVEDIGEKYLLTRTIG